MNKKEQLDELILGTSFIIGLNLKNFLQLQVRNQNLSCDHISTLIWGLEQNNVFQELILTSCMIDDQGAIALSLWLQQNQSLYELDISSNRITDFGAELIFRSLQNHKEIKSINISKNLIEKDYIGEEFLIKNQQIENLNISENPYSLQSVESLLKGLVENDKIKRVNMSGIQLGQIHKLFLLEVIEKNRSLTELCIDIDIQQDDYETLRKFEEALLFNCELVRLESRKLEIEDNNQFTLKLWCCLKANEILGNKSESQLNKILHNTGMADNMNQTLREIILQKIEIIRQNENMIQYTEEIIQESRFFKLPDNDTSNNSNNGPNTSMDNFCRKSLNLKPPTTNLSTCPQTQPNGNFLISQSNYSPTQMNSDAFIFGMLPNQTTENDTKQFSMNNFSNTMMEDNRTYPTFQTMKSNDKNNTDMFQVNQILNNKNIGLHAYQQNQNNYKMQQYEQQGIVEGEILNKLEDIIYQKVKSNLEQHFNTQFTFMYQELEKYDGQIKSLQEDFHSLKRDFTENKLSRKNSKTILRTGDNLIPTRGFSEAGSYQNIENVDASQIYKSEDPFQYQSEIDDISVLQKIHDFQKKMQQTKSSIQKSRRNFSRERLRERGSVSDLSQSINNSISLNNNNNNNNNNNSSFQNKTILQESTNQIYQNNNKSSQRYQNINNNNLNHSISRRDSNCAILVDQQGSGSTSLKSSHLGSQDYSAVYTDNLTGGRDGVLRMKDLSNSQNSNPFILQKSQLNNQQQQCNKFNQSRSSSNKENSISGYSCLNTSVSYRKNPSNSNSRNNLYQKSVQNQLPSEELVEELKRRGIYLN